MEIKNKDEFVKVIIDEVENTENDENTKFIIEFEIRTYIKKMGALPVKQKFKQIENINIKRDSKISV